MCAAENWWWYPNVTVVNNKVSEVVIDIHIGGSTQRFHVPASEICNDSGTHHSCMLNAGSPNNSNGAMAIIAAWAASNSLPDPGARQHLNGGDQYSVCSVTVGNQNDDGTWRVQVGTVALNVDWTDPCQVWEFRPTTVTPSSGATGNVAFGEHFKNSIPWTSANKWPEVAGV